MDKGRAMQKLAMDWLNAIDERFNDVMEMISTGEIDINDVKRIELIDESKELPTKNIEVKNLQVKLIKNINHYFTRTLQEKGALDELEKMAIENAIKTVMGQIRTVLFQ